MTRLTLVYIQIYVIYLYLPSTTHCQIRKPARWNWEKINQEFYNIQQPRPVILQQHAVLHHGGDHLNLTYIIKMKTVWVLATEAPVLASSYLNCLCSVFTLQPHLFRIEQVPRPRTLTLPAVNSFFQSLDMKLRENLLQNCSFSFNLYICIHCWRHVTVNKVN